MAGIYVHIPFCKSRCIYCGFFSTTLLQKRHEYVDAVVEELRQRRTFLVDEPVDTIYFGEALLLNCHLMNWKGYWCQFIIYIMYARMQK